MIESELHVTEAAVREKLLPLLQGRVFHVTCASRVKSILEAGAIQANTSGALPSAFPSASNSLFRQRGSVCVFDYRSLDNHQLRVALDACAPDMPTRSCDSRLAIMFLAPENYPELQIATIDDLSKGMVVPYAEAGYPSAIPVTAIEELLVVTVEPRHAKGIAV